MSLRDWIIAAAVVSLMVAIAWIGLNVGRLLDELVALKERVRIAEGNLTNAEDGVARVDERVTRVDEAVARRCRNVELRQDRLQTKVDNWGKNWRDSGQCTANLDLTGPMTMIDLRKP